MSDQSFATQKPKPGSLRDRIAAFEKSATSGATPAVAPPPRHKPAALATWKPTQTSPPPSPPASRTEHVQVSSSAMSASDARESITKGASLKERMAALQNKGAFGAPLPPVGPKPVVERPKWKPPPVAQADGAGSEGISAIEKSLSPIAAGYQQNTGDPVQGEPDPTHGTTAEGVNEETEISQDPEEDERRRRAAIAARMARLGGARVGMAPPIIGKKPLVRRPTQEEQQPNTVEAKPAEIPLQLDPSASPEEQHLSSNEPVSVLSELDTQKPGLAPSRKSSVNTTTGVDSVHSPKIPTSMPVPAVPRRAGPPRKKPSKPTAPPPESPNEEPTTTVPDIVESTPVPEHEDPESTLGTSIGPISKEASSTPPEDLEVSSALRDSAELENPEIVKLSESASSLPLSGAHSQADLPTFRAIEVVDELPRQIPPSPSKPPVERAFINVSERASGIVEHEEVEDNVAQDHLIAKPLDRKDLTGLSSNIVSVLEEVHSKPSKPSDSVQDNFLHEDQKDVVNYDSRLGKPTDQNPPLLPPIPAARLSLEFETEFRVIDVPQHSEDNSAPLEQRPSPPPRRFVPPAPEGAADQEEPESDEETNENLARSHLLIPPPKERKIYPDRNIQDEDDDGDGSENDAPALPVPHRRSSDMRSSRSIQSDSSSELDSDHDGQPLPVLPRPTMRVVPPPQSQQFPQHENKDLKNVAISISASIPLDREVMDEDEGDPIDPDIHIPSRRTSFFNLAHQESSPSTHATLPSHSPPISGSRPQNTLQIVPSPGQENQPEETVVESEEIPDETRKRTIAERMARLGGIKFGAAPIPRSTSSGVQESDRVDTSGTVEDKADEPSNKEEEEEEEEEKARKERIAAKLATMGGMRIGMMPMGMPAKGTQFREETALSSPPTPVAPVRPSRLAPQPPADTERGTGSPVALDDGAQLEVEEGDAQEVDYQDAAPEEIPSIPSRSGRPTRRQSSGDTAVSPPPPARRPPVPATPPRRMSATVPSPQSTPPRRKDSSQTVHYDYVMVDQVESQEALPTRRSSVAHSAQSVPEGSKSGESQENISSQWEIPSEFGSGTDLSLSCSDAGDTVLTSQHTQSASLQGKPRRQPTIDKSLSADDLIALWGRVGVQVCEVATTIFEKSKKSLIGDGTYAGFVKAVLEDVPNAAQLSIDAGEYGYLIYSQSGGVVQKRASEIMPGDIVEIHDARFKGHKGLQTYQQTVGGSGEPLSGIIAEFEIKRSKVKVFQANQHVGQQTVELVSYRLEDLKSGTIKVYRVLEAV